MSSGWNVVKIGHIADVAYGYTEKASFEEIGPKFLRITDIQDDAVDWVTVPYCQVNAKDHKRHQLLSGDIVFARTGATTGKSYLINEPPNAVCASYLIRLRLTAETALPEFVQLFFQTSAYWETVEAGTSGSAQGGFNASKLSNLEIPLPPLDEQRRIVAVLDKAFAGIATATANAQKNLTNARALFESYVDDVFDRPDDNWCKQTIGDIASIKGGKRVPKGYRLLNEPTPFAYISVADFNDEGSVDTKKIRYISEQIFTQIKRYIISKDDLYISIAGTVGKTGIVPPELDGASLTENACRLVFKSDVLNHFVYYFTLTSSFKHQAIEQTRTAAQPKLALSRLQQICLPVPSVNVQEQLIEKFDDLVEKVRRVETQYHQKLTALAELKQSLLQKAFAGELT